MSRRVAVFTVGILPVDNEVGAKAEHEGAVERILLRTSGVKPVSYGVFAGAYDPEKVDFVSRILMEKKNVPTGDPRDS
jgi:menaquinone-dependent protoporphyrinogen IX oxidase